ncbi:hypothetical protein BDR07DRAFT_1482957 [Suillus spraguei]|nr:hypothetical protein BDR07DRAFT_1482957 [Suillus spraguei]
MPPKATSKKRRPQCQNAKTIRKPGRNSGINPLLLSEQSQIGLDVEQTQHPMDYLELSMLVNEDPDTDNMEEYEDDEESHFHLTLPYLQPTPPAHNYRPPPPTHNYQEDLFGPSSRDPCPSSHYAPPLSFSQPAPCHATPEPSDRNVFSSCYVLSLSSGPSEYQFWLSGHEDQGSLVRSVIKAMAETTVTVPVPSSRALPPPFTPLLPTTNVDATGHMPEPNPPQFLTMTDKNEVMKEAKQIMRERS